MSGLPGPDPSLQEMPAGLLRLTTVLTRDVSDLIAAHMCGTSAWLSAAQASLDRCMTRSARR